MKYFQNRDDGRVLSLPDWAREFNLSYWKLYSALRQGRMSILQECDRPGEVDCVDLLTGQPIPPPSPTPAKSERNAALLAFYQNAPDGVTLQQVGDAFRVTRERVRQILGRYMVRGGRKYALQAARGERPRDIRITAAKARQAAKARRRARLIALYDSGLTLKEVAARVGLAWQTVRLNLIRAGHSRRRPGQWLNRRKEAA